jgi:hypothetical protein
MPTNAKKGKEEDELLKALASFLAKLPKLPRKVFISRFRSRLALLRPRDEVFATEGFARGSCDGVEL